MSVIHKIYGAFLGADIAITINNGNISLLYGKAPRKMLDEIQMTCKIHGVESGCIFLIKHLQKYHVKTKGDAVKIEQSLMNVVNLF